MMPMLHFAILILSASDVAAGGAKLRGGKLRNEHSGRFLRSSEKRELDSIKYYSIPSSGMCAIVDQSTPSWITTFYTDWTKCCEAGWAVKACLAAAPSGAVPGTNSAAASILYYVSPSTAMCGLVDAYTPNWMTEDDFFSSYDECCNNSWNIERCMADKPPGLPTTSPSAQPTPPELTGNVTESIAETSTNTTVSPELTTGDPVTTGLVETLANSTETPTNTTEPTTAAPASTVDGSVTTVSVTSTAGSNVTTQTPTTVVPGSTTDAPEVTVPATTAATGAPLTTTEATDSTTNAPQTTTGAAVNTTAAPEPNPSCQSALWHVSGDFSACSNSFDYPDAWDSPALKNDYLFEESSMCCGRFFFMYGKRCALEDICASDTTTSSTRINSDCQSTMWHVSSDFSKCTNSLGYDPAWDSPTLKDSFLFDTVDGCCERFFEAYNNTCTSEDVCAPQTTSSVAPESESTTEAPDTTKTPTTEAPKTITSSVGLETTIPTQTSETTASSAPSDPALPCISDQWHPDVITRDGCSNSLDVPEDWEQELFFNSSAECCESFFGNEECVVHKVCDEAQTTLPATTSVAPNVTQATTDTSETGSTRTSTQASEPTLAPETTKPNTVTTDGTVTEAPAETTSPVIVTDPVDATTATPATEVSETTIAPESTKISPATTTNAPESTYLACSSNQWHPDVVNKDGCSNSLNFPDEWQGMSMYFYDTSQECCDFFFSDENCPVYDLCQHENPGPNETTTVAPNVTEATTDPSETGSTQTSTQASESTLAPETTKSNTVTDATQMSSQPPETTYRPATTTEIPKTTESAVTATTTTCISALWHPSEDGSKCTNSFGYRASWDEPPLNANYLHETVQQCCQIFFEAWGRTCVIEDICRSGSNISPTTTGATHGPCESNRWHPSSDFKRCSNSIYYPDEWNSSDLQEEYLHSSQELCCEAFFLVEGKNCEVEDTCTNTLSNISPTTTGVTDGPCESNRWHPSSDFKRCSNSLDYPEGWNTPSMQETYLHSSHELCCEAFFLVEGNNCEVEDTCSETITAIELPTNAPTSKPSASPSLNPTANPTSNPTTCESNTWHVSTDFKRCTNSPNYPPSWNEPGSIYLHATSELCCENFFFNEAKSCEVEDSCSGKVVIIEPPTNAPTSRPTDNPTTQSPTMIQPTQAPTAMPTEPPSKAPTDSPSAVVRYYSIPSSGMCAVVNKDTPAWITTFFSDWTECCKVGWVFDACIAAAPN